MIYGAITTLLTLSTLSAFTQGGTVKRHQTSEGDSTCPSCRWHDDCGISKYEDACTSVVPQSRIVGGVDAREGEIPWMAVVKCGGQHMCGGVLIDNRWVLTAAHCMVYKETGPEYSVSVGENNLEDLENPSKAEYQLVSSDIFVHPDYAGNNEMNDIALLRIPQPVVLNENVTPACAPEEDDDVTGLPCTVSGWGKTSVDEHKSNNLKYTNIPVVEHSACVETYDGIRQIYPTNICAGLEEGGQDACLGDSGGPLVYQKDGLFTLYGLVIWGQGCAQPGKPGVYTRVQSFLSWIDSVRSACTMNTNSPMCSKLSPLTKKSHKSKAHSQKTYHSNTHHKKEVHTRKDFAHGNQNDTPL